MKLKLTVIISIIVGTFTIVGGIIAFDERYAKYDHLCQVEHRLEQKIVYDRINNLQQRMWSLEDRYGADEARRLEEYRKLQQEKNLLDRKLRD